MKTLKNDDLACEHCYDKDCQLGKDEVTHCFIWCLFHTSIDRHYNKQDLGVRCDVCNKFIPSGVAPGGVVLNHYSSNFENRDLTVCPRCYDKIIETLDHLEKD